MAQLSALDLLTELECAVCMDTYCSIASEDPSDFGIFQCQHGHCVCSGCFKKITDGKCVSCRMLMPEPAINRTLQNIIVDLPAKCQWPTCQQSGLRVCTLKTHEDTCVHRLACGPAGEPSALYVHQAGCVPHPIQWRDSKTAQLQADVSNYRDQLQLGSATILSLQATVKAAQAETAQARAQAQAAHAETLAARAQAQRALADTLAARPQAQTALADTLAARAHSPSSAASARPMDAAWRCIEYGKRLAEDGEGQAWLQSHLSQDNGPSVDPRCIAFGKLLAQVDASRARVQAESAQADALAARAQNICADPFQQAAARQAAARQAAALKADPTHRWQASTLGDWAAAQQSRPKRRPFSTIFREAGVDQPGDPGQL